MSGLIVAALKEVTLDRSLPILQIRERVANSVGISLEFGQARAFFDKKVQRYFGNLKASKPRKRKRSKKPVFTVLADVSKGNPLVERRELMAMNLEDMRSHVLR